MRTEIEAYIEDRAQELLLDTAWRYWKKSRIPSEVVVSLLAFSDVAISRPPNSLGGGPNKKAYDDVGIPLQKAYNIWLKSHKDNHGIKEANVLSLLLPLGIQHTKFDTTLLADLSSYGSARGDVAHRSHYKIQVFADPKIEHETAFNLITDLVKLDALICLAIRRINKFAIIK